MLNKINKLLPIVNKYRLAEEWPELILYKDKHGYALEEKVNNQGMFYIHAIGLANIFEYLKNQFEWYTKED